MINTGQIAQLLLPGLRAAFGQYPTYPDQWKEIYKTYSSDKYQEVEVEMKFLGPADFKEEGQPIASDSMGQRFITYYIHKRVGLSFTITKEAIEDNLYKNEFPKQAISLREALRATKNILGANLLNNAFNTAAPIGDGQPLCSKTHPIDGGVFANAFTTGDAIVDFSEAGLEEAIIQIQQFPMQSGMLSQTMPKKLIIPRQLQFAASRLLHSTNRVDTANNDINALYNDNYIPEGYKVNQFLVSPSAWFILTDAPDGFKHYQRTPVETDTYVDYPTDNVMSKATERYSFGVSNPRAIFGSQGV